MQVAMEGGKNARVSLPLLGLVVFGLAFYGVECRSKRSQSAQRSFGTPRVLTSLTDKGITESSGVAPSQIADGVFYTFNDSGDSARFFKFNRNGKILHVYKLPNARNVDWEDM